MKRLDAIPLIAAIMLAAVPAHALCTYDGVDNASTTLVQEFHDSKWVAKVRVLSERNNFATADDAYEEPWSLYELKVVENFKGRPPDTLRFFTRRNSGGFYFDRLSAGPDIGGEYLVFLNTTPDYPGEPGIEKGTVFVNYNCGQSRPWTEVSQPDLKTLRRLKSH